MIEDHIVGWIVAVVLGLSGAVTFLYKQINSLREQDMERLETRRMEDMQDISNKLEHCEEKHEQMNTHFIRLTEDFGRLEGKMEGREETLKTVQTVLTKITDRIVEKLPGWNEEERKTGT